MANRVEIGSLKIDERLYRLVRNEIAPGTGIKADSFWKSLGTIVEELGPKNRALLVERDRLQEQIDRWHQERKGRPFDIEEDTNFLKEIGYIVPKGRISGSRRATSMPRSLRLLERNLSCRSTMAVTR